MIMNDFFPDYDVIESNDSSPAPSTDSAAYPQTPRSVASVIPIEAILSHLNSWFTKSSYRKYGP